MISIQDLGLSILSDNPSKLYFLGGQEYGVKDKYLSKLESLYGFKEEYSGVKEFLDFMSVKHLIKIPPKLYVVRYDENFISSLSEVLANKLKSCKINGTLVCIYSEDKHLSKVDKYFPENCCSIDSVNIKFIEKYLKSDFPALDSRFIKVAAQSCKNYGQARNVCKSMINSSKSSLDSMTEEQLKMLFGLQSTSQESDIRTAFCSRNFKTYIKYLDSYVGDLSNLYYTLLQAMIELEKIHSSKYSSSDLLEYSRLWKLSDIYYMFIHTYRELEKSRSSISCNTYNSLIYLGCLTTFSDVPSPEVLNGV